MGDQVTDALMGHQQVPTAAPPPADDAERVRLQDSTMRGMEAQMQPRQSLAPLAVNPKAKQPGMGTAIAAGAVSMFMPFLGKAVMDSVKAQKEAQITEATNEFNSLNDALEMASTMANMEALQGKLPKDKVQERTDELWKLQPAYKALFDPNNPAAKKRYKNFAKVFQQPWATDGKSTPHAEGLKRFMQMKPHSDMVKKLGQSIQDKQQGGQGGPQQPQGQPQGGQGGGQPQPQQQQQPPQQAQQPAPADQMQRRLNMPDPKALTPYSEYIKALEAYQNRYEMKFDNEGKPFGFDKRTNQAKEVQVQRPDGTTYTPTMMVRGLNGKVALVDNVPMGVYGVTDNGQPGVKHPGDKNWTSADASTFAAAKAAWVQGEAEKDKRVKLSADFRAKAWAATREYSVYDAETGNMVMANALEIASNRGRYAGAPQAMQLTNRTNLFNEIQGTENELKRVIDNLGDVEFDSETKAKLAMALKSDAPNSSMDAFLKSNVAATLSQAQVEYVTALAAMEESALSMRTLGGMGQGSDMMRAAILRMVPSAGTPSAAYARRQLELFDIELKGLKKNQPGLGNLDKGDKGNKGKPKQSLQDYLEEQKRKRAGGG